MIRESLGNLALRIWVAVLVAMPLAMVGIPIVYKQALGQKMVILSGLMVCGCFLAVNWALNILATFFVHRLGREAAVWERAGRTNEARRALELAMAVLDGWLPSPAVRKKLGFWLGARLARFVLSRRNPKRQDLQSVINYLRFCPGDRDAAKGLLRWCVSSGRCHQLDPDLFTLLASHYHDEQEIQIALAGIFLKSGRTDFTALGTYNKLLQSKGHQAEEIIIQLAHWFRQVHRIDELALAAFLAVVEKTSDSKLFIEPIIACLRQGKFLPHDLRRQAEKILEKIPEARSLVLSNNYQV